LKAAPARLLIVAGSDSSGGAGIQADIKTATALGVYAMTAVTAVTVQDTTRVHAIHLVPPSIIGEQIACVLADIGADAIKIGMLGSADAVDAVADALEAHGSGIPILLDPVLVSSSGTSLLSDDAVARLKDRLLPLTNLLTPNISEAEHLSGVAFGSRDDMLRAADALRQMGADAVLIKGGHAPGTPVRDILVSKTGIEEFENPRIPTRSTHGTGCTLACAIACGLAQQRPLTEAVRSARAFVQAALETAPNLGRGQGPLNHLHDNPRPE
jgi:hydroxymethylpyrimidine/phosphomethylpyrimidine kinase